MPKDLLTKAIVLYFRVKTLYILAEETTPNFKDFLQPVFEVNRAFDHLARMYAANFGLNENHIENIDDYADGNLRKVIGHLYRAYFDILDWLAVNLRESVINEFKAYSHQCIKDVIPEYYEEVRPSLEDVSSKIAEIRAKKDVDNDGTIELIDKYENIILFLREQLKDLQQKKPAVVDCEERRKQEDKRKRNRQIVITAVFTIIGVALGFLLKSIFN